MEFPRFRKLTVEKYEREFETKKMRDRRLFYDLNIRVGDPEELRSDVNELLQDMDYDVVLNELTKFEDAEMDKMFMGGRLKPLKAVIKAKKIVRKGPKFPLIWKTFFILGLVSIVISLLPKDFGFTGTFRYISLGFFVLAGLVYLIKEKIPLVIWIKIVGIYNVQDEQADVRVVLAGDILKEDKTVFSKLEDELSEVYNVLARKYIKKLSKRQIVSQIKLPEKAKTNPEARILEIMADVDKELSKLERNLINGKITEATYKELKEKLQKKKEKLSTIYDLLNI